MHLERQNTDIAVFGARLGGLAYDNIARGDLSLSDEAEKEARMLAETVKTLTASTDEDDKKSMEVINRHFALYEQPLLLAHPPRGIETLPSENIMQWLADASYREIAVFSLWHYGVQKELQRRITVAQPVLHLDILDKANYLIENGIFPAHALALYQKSCADHRIIKPIDSFLLGSTLMSGYRTKQEIGMATPFKDPYFKELDGYMVQHLMFHEMTHDVGGQANKWGADFRGFNRGITQISHHRATEEFFVEHLTTISAARTDPDIIDPDERQDGLHFYHRERKLHSIISRNIPVDLWGHAYIESRHSLRGLRLRRELAIRIGRAFGSWERYLQFSHSDAQTVGGAHQNTFLDNTIALLSGQPLPAEKHD